jgi:hypothetical protein
MANYWRKSKAIQKLPILTEKIRYWFARPPKTQFVFHTAQKTREVVWGLRRDSHTYTTRNKGKVAKITNKRRRKKIIFGEKSAINADFECFLLIFGNFDLFWFYKSVQFSGWILWVKKEKRNKARRAQLKPDSGSHRSGTNEFGSG